jgi:glycine oxidase
VKQSKARGAGSTRAHGKGKNLSFEIVVVGGGVIGLSCAWKLARAGARVLLLERGQPGLEASWAAAGLVAAHSEIGGHSAERGSGAEKVLSENEIALRGLCLHSRALYPGFADELEECSGLDVGLSLNRARPDDSIQPGILHIAEGEVRFDSDEGIEEVTPARAQQLCGMELHAPDARFFWLAREGQVDSRALLRALLEASLKAGVEVRSATNVTGFNVKDGQITSIVTPAELIPCRHVLWATGAWSAQAEGLPPACLPPVFPVAGQVMALRPPRLPRCIVYGSGVYLAPKRDGRLLLGATSEDTGFEKRVTSAAAAQLFDAAQTLMPELQPSQIEDQWAGLRPATPDGLPILGPTPVPNFSLATGHFRNGILLAPATAQLLCDYLLNGASIPAPFQLSRFHAEES